MGSGSHLTLPPDGNFTPDDFDALELYLNRYSALLTTPAVLTEVSNLMGNAFHEVIAGTIVDVCGPFAEHAAGKEAVLADDGFERLGFADASILCAIAAEAETEVLTDDAKLYTEILYRGGVAINFNHIRPPGHG